MMSYPTFTRLLAVGALVPLLTLAAGCGDSEKPEDPPATKGSVESRINEVQEGGVEVDGLGEDLDRLNERVQEGLEPSKAAEELEVIEWLNEESQAVDEEIDPFLDDELDLLEEEIAE